MKKQIIQEIEKIYPNSECAYSGNERIMYVHKTGIAREWNISGKWSKLAFKVIIQS